jgi:hypothetical protein
VFFQPAPPIVLKIQAIKVLDDLVLVNKAAQRQLLGDAGRTGPAADQRRGHDRSDDEKLPGKPDVVFIGVPGRQPGQDERVGDVPVVDPAGIR